MLLENDPSLIPLPVHMAIEPGCFELTAETTVFYDGEPAKHAAHMAAEQLRPATGFSLPIFDIRTLSSSSKTIVFRISADEASSGESYSLNASVSNVIISAQTPAGLFFGLQTLRQLLPPEIFSAKQVSKVWKIPGVSVRDFPRFGWRGMHLDVSRHFMPKNDVLRFIDTISSLKFNMFHWHLTDDQGWRIEIKKYPKLTEVGAWRKESRIGHQESVEVKYDGLPHGGFYTQDEIREVVQYAADRCITVVPEVDMPGHMQAAITAYPELASAPEPLEVRCEWGISSAVLNPEESTIQFCTDILTEIMGLFPGKYIHIGGDEVDKIAWENNPRIQQLRCERGLKNMHEMQSWFIHKLEEFLTEHGRRLIGWDEILEGGQAGNVAVVAWRGEAEGIAAAKAGHQVVMASHKYFYFDSYQARPVELEPLAIGGFIPLEKVYAHDPSVPDALTEEERGRILGAQGQLWTEYMSSMKQVEYMAFPRTCALAETVWTPSSLKNYGKFVQRLTAELKRLERAGVYYRKIDPTAQLKD